MCVCVCVCRESGVVSVECGKGLQQKDDYITTQQQAFLALASSFSSRSGTRGVVLWAVVGGCAGEIGDAVFERCMCGDEGGIVGVIL